MPTFLRLITLFEVPRTPFLPMLPPGPRGTLSPFVCGWSAPIPEIFYNGFFFHLFSFCPGGRRLNLPPLKVLELTFLDSFISFTTIYPHPRLGTPCLFSNACIVPFFSSEPSGRFFFFLDQSSPKMCDGLVGLEFLPSLFPDFLYEQGVFGFPSTGVSGRARTICSAPASLFPPPSCPLVSTPSGAASFGRLLFLLDRPCVIRALRFTMLPLPGLPRLMPFCPRCLLFLFFPVAVDEQMLVRLLLVPLLLIFLRRASAIHSPV